MATPARTLAAGAVALGLLLGLLALAVPPGVGRPHRLFSASQTLLSPSAAALHISRPVAPEARRHLTTQFATMGAAPWGTGREGSASQAEADAAAVKAAISDSLLTSALGVATAALLVVGLVTLVAASLAILLSSQCLREDETTSAPTIDAALAELYRDSPPPPPYQMEPPAVAHALWAKMGYTLLDVRSEVEWEQNSVHIPPKTWLFDRQRSVIHIPLVNAAFRRAGPSEQEQFTLDVNRQWLARVAARVPKDARLLVLCSDGGVRTAHALRLLAGADYRDAQGVAGGLHGWAGVAP
eukprot:EG_transcript_19628